MKPKSILFLSFFLCCIVAGTSQNFKIFVSDAGNFNNPPWQILSFDIDGSNGEVFTDEELGWPQDILFLPDQNVVLISNLTTGLINRHAASTGDYRDVFAEVPGGPTRMKIGDDGLIYVLQWQGNGRVLRYQQDGTFVDEFTTVGVPNSIGLDWDDAGNLYVSSYNGGTVRQFDTSGNDMGLFIETELAGPTNLWFEDDGDLLVLDWSGGSIDRFDSSGNFQGSLTTDISQPEGIDLLPNGNYIAGNGEAGAPGSIRVFDNAGNTIEDIVPAGTLDLLQPNAVVVFDTSTLTIEEVSLQEPWLYPTIGNQFSLNPAITSEYSEWIIYDIHGKQIARLSTEQQHWSAIGVSAGIYFVQLRGPSATKTQKIVIR